MQKYLLYIVVFICGAMVMILELVASRILAPFVGTSSYVWTSLIGIILGSLSFGYWLGGRLADRNPKRFALAMILFNAAIFIGATTFINILVLSVIEQYISDIRIAAIISTLVLFSFPSVLLGMVSPYAVKLQMADIDKTGSTVGNLYAISTIGSIVGTFLAGFVLIPSFGSEKNLLIISIVLLFTSFIVYFDKGFKLNILFFIILIMTLLIPNPAFLVYGKTDLKDIDTEYSRIWIYPTYYENKEVKVFQTGNEYSSAMYLNNDELVFEYTKYYDLAEHFNTGFNKALMLGGAAYSYPKYYLNKYTNATIDVAEIDSRVTDIAKSEFRLKNNPRLRIFHEDGRIFLNKTKNKYDVIYGDAFRSKSVPYQLTTKDAVEKMYNVLNDNGVVVINIISSIEGDKGKFFRGEYKTYKNIFPQVYVFPVEGIKNGEEIQNIMLVALKSKDKPSFESTDSELNEYLAHLWKEEIPNDIPILTDDYSPVEYYTMGIR